MCKVKVPRVDKGDNEIWVPQPGLLIPSIPPTNLGGTLCKIIEVQYFLDFEVIVCGRVARDHLYRSGFTEAS